MHELENESSKRAKKGQLERIALSALATAGVVGLMLAAPNMVKLLRGLDMSWASKQDPARRLRDVAYRLKRKHLIEWSRVHGRIRMRITPAGKRHLDILSHGAKPLLIPKRWDGKWRLLAFDIPEKRRRTRDRVREVLSVWGFIRFQDSVWIYPYDCEEVMTLLKNDLHIGNEMRYVIADAVEYDAPFRRHFGLKG